MGAEDYLEKPIDLEKLKIVVKKIAEKRGLLAEVQSLKRQQQDLYRKDYLFLTDPAMQKIYEQIEQVARQEKVTALVLGGNRHGQRACGPADPFLVSARRQTLCGTALRISARIHPRIRTFWL